VGGKVKFLICAVLAAGSLAGLIASASPPPLRSLRSLRLAVCRSIRPFDRGSFPTVSVTL
jgi:hypothetical protein